MNDINIKVDALLSKAEWQEERKRLRSIILECQLTEEVKWGKISIARFQKSNWDAS